MTGAADVHPLTSTPFALPARLAAKADPALIADDERHFAALADSLAHSMEELAERLDAERRSPGGTGQEAMERDLDVHRLTARLRTLRRFGLDLCLGHIVPADGSGTIYIGRVGLTGRDGRRLLCDWRSPAAEPFFGATHGDPMGLTRRRRYRWTGGRITDYWDELFDPHTVTGRAALDDQSAFIASLAGARSSRMRDVLATIQSDQDAIIRAGSRGTLVVDGGPGTGKTVVALHRSAYLLYADPMLGHHRGGVLFVGPHQPYLDYVADVLPGLGEEGVQTCTLRQLVPEGGAATIEAEPEVARLKSSARLVGAIEKAVAIYEEAPTRAVTVTTEWVDVRLGAADWAEAFAAAEPGTPHNEAREAIWAALLDLVVDRHDDEVPSDQLRASLEGNRELRKVVTDAWPLLEPTDVVADLWSVPAYLRACAPWLAPDEIRALRREPGQPWTVSDLPLLDAARARLGDPRAEQRRRRREAELSAERARMTRVIDDLLQGPDEDGMLAQLRQHGIRQALEDESVLPEPAIDRLAGPFAHVVVDEAQELTDAEWQMILARCPSRSLTVVGDRAQARHGFAETWTQRLERIGLDRITQTSLTINYRTPEEVMAAAEPVIRAALPDANVPTSVRRSGVPVRHAEASELPRLVAAWLAANDDGIACVIGDPAFPTTDRVRSLTPELAKGLEFDLVIVVDPAGFGEGIEGAVDRYVAMTRATRQLVIVRTVPPQYDPDN